MQDKFTRNTYTLERLVSFLLWGGEIREPFSPTLGLQWIGMLQCLSTRAKKNSTEFPDDNIFYVERRETRS